MAKWRVEYPGGFYLRGTTATGDQSRAQEFDSEEAAKAALVKNKQFLKPAAFKGANIVRFHPGRRADNV
jgi:hypothetical protein